MENALKIVEMERTMDYMNVTMETQITEMAAIPNVKLSPNSIALEDILREQISV